MAHFIGAAGNFQKEKSINRRLRAIMALFLLMATFFFLIGFVTAKQSLLWSILAVVIVLPAFKLFERLLNTQLRIARAEEDGADGEREIIPFLRNLPDTFTVVSDLDFADSYGNIDHLIVGPTGLYAIDVKNWRGNVTGDGKGELLLNGRPTDKPQVRYFTRRTMELKDRLNALTKLDPYIRALFVFPRTHIDAKWGTTGAVHCLRIEQVSDYITQGKGGKAVSGTDLPRLLAAAKALKDTVATPDRPTTA